MNENGTLYRHFRNLGNGGEPIEVFDGLSHIGTLHFECRKILDNNNAFAMSFLNGEIIFVTESASKIIESPKNHWEQIVVAKKGQKFDLKTMAQSRYKVSGIITEPGETLGISKDNDLGLLEVNLTIEKNKRDTWRGSKNK